MDVVLAGYEVNGPTWFYLSLLLIVAVYFRFTRVFSLRNVDLGLLLSASPGLLLLRPENDAQLHVVGHTWLFVITCLFLVRLFIDGTLKRRPYLGQNLNAHGLGFLCASVLVFLSAKAITESLPEATHVSVQQADALIHRTATDPESGASEVTAGPAVPLITAPVAYVFDDLAAKILAILGHIAVVTGLWFIGRNLFNDTGLGMAMATMYLLLPCTAYNVGEFNHVLPSALIVWAVVCYRRPLISGILLGLACGAMFFPVVLLPIWAAFYGKQGAKKFAIALVCVALVLTASLALTSSDPDSFYRKTIGTLNMAVNLFSDTPHGGGFWEDAGYFSPYRIPVMTAYFIAVIIMTIWPRRRSLEVLIAQSAAVVVGTQLWYTQKGGVYLLWYFPLLLMVVFRPRLTTQTFEEAEDSESNRTKKETERPTNITRTAASRLQLFR